MECTPDLETWLDRDRGRDNGGYGDPRPPLRAILFAPYPYDRTCHWDWLRGRTDGRLRAHRTGVWDSNQLDYLDAAEWELERRRQIVSDDQVRAWAAEGVRKHCHRGYAPATGATRLGEK
jgi:hypothetical protein